MKRGSLRVMMQCREVFRIIRKKIVNLIKIFKETDSAVARKLKSVKFKEKNIAVENSFSKEISR